MRFPYRTPRIQSMASPSSSVALRFFLFHRISPVSVIRSVRFRNKLRQNEIRCQIRGQKHAAAQIADRRRNFKRLISDRFLINFVHRFESKQKRNCQNLSRCSRELETLELHWLLANRIGSMALCGEM